MTGAQIFFNDSVEPFLDSDGNEKHFHLTISRRMVEVR
jgi:hypothetical protein